MTTPVPFRNTSWSPAPRESLAAPERSPAPRTQGERRRRHERRFSLDRRLALERRASVDNPRESVRQLALALTGGIALALVWTLALRLLASGADVLRLEAVLLALSAFIYPAAAWRVGNLAAFVLSGVVAAGFFWLGLLGIRHGATLLVLGFGLHAAWGLLQGLATLERLAPTLGWAGLQFGCPFRFVLA